MSAADVAAAAAVVVEDAGRVDVTMTTELELVVDLAEVVAVVDVVVDVLVVDELVVVEVDVDVGVVLVVVVLVVVLDVEPGVVVSPNTSPKSCGARSCKRLWSVNTLRSRRTLGVMAGSAGCKATLDEAARRHTVKSTVDLRMLFRNWVASRIGSVRTSDRMTSKRMRPYRV